MLMVLVCVSACPAPTSVCRSHRVSDHPSGARDFKAIINRLEWYCAAFVLHLRVSHVRCDE